MQHGFLSKARLVPANFGPLRGANGNARLVGSCGDTMEFWVRVEEGVIRQITFTTDGCGHSIACGRVAAALAEGKRLKEAGALTSPDILEVLPALPETSWHCAFLAVDTLKAALSDEAGRNGTGKEHGMRIAIPLAEGRLSMHFGHCEKFALFDVDPQSRRILREETVDAPEHQPGILPGWLAGKEVGLVIAGGMGRHAMDLFEQRKIGVLVGAPVEEPEQLVKRHLEGTLKTDGNICDH